MNAIWYFALWTLLIFVMMRFGCGAHVMGRGHGHRDKADAPDVPENATDPVCGMSVDPKAAKTSVFDGRIHYFCSAACREKFEAAPHDYIGASAARPTTMEVHHGAH